MYAVDLIHISMPGGPEQRLIPLTLTVICMARLVIFVIGLSLDDPHSRSPLILAFSIIKVADKEAA